LRGEETGLTDEERGFDDALAENQSARQVMGEPTLRVIAQELVTGLPIGASFASSVFGSTPKKVKLRQRADRSRQDK
jgi:hypothetical protein